MPESAVTIPHPDFGIVNYGVVVLYMAALIGVGWYISRRGPEGTRGFFVASGKMNFFIVGISTFAAYLSALTMMGLPAMAFGDYKLFWTIQYPVIIIPAFVVTRWLVGRYRDAGVISVYEYFEQRIGVSARLLGAFSFILFSLARSGLVLLMPALAFHIVTGFPLEATIVIMGLVVTIYTMLGGITAVVWNEFAQACIIFTGATISIIFVLTATGWTDFMQIAAEHHKFEVFRGGFDITRKLSIWLILFAILDGIRTWGTQQDMTQRFLTTPTTPKAKMSVWVAALAYIPFGYLFHFVGVALFVYFTVTPDPAVEALKQAERVDAIYPYFVATRLPVGLSGLVITAIFAAAMSSIDSCMNAASAVCVEDFLKRFFQRNRSDRYYLNAARWLTLIWGLVVVALALSFRNIPSAQVIWPKVISVSTNGILGLLALVLWPRRIQGGAAVVGFMASYLVLFYLMFGTTVDDFLWPVFGNATCFLVGLALSYVLTGRGGRSSSWQTRIRT
ncbi:MAG: sodium/solute symporter [Pirellulales bacterium]|nr:sodium/solute symporter [Pirellulales bacterium]